jgi:hypothetical protein
MDEDWFRSFVASAAWVFAKTMPESPHWYALRRTCDHTEFERAVIEIRANRRGIAALVAAAPTAG